MPESLPDLDTVLDELRQSGEAIGSLAEDEKAFTLAQEAFREKNAARFQEALVAVGIFEHCRLVCRWFCSVRSPPALWAALRPRAGCRARPQSHPRVLADHG